MSRVMKHPHPEVRRVLTEPFDLSDFPVQGTRFAARRAQPYRAGDVIRVSNGREALVVYTFVERVREADEFSDLLPMLRVCERKPDGAWSKLWRNVWPGEIEIGFRKHKKECTNA